MPDCESCKEKQRMIEPIPFIAHESAMARMERTIKRLWILLMILVVLLVGSNVAWIIYESQWEVYETTEVTQENERGVNSYIGNDGDIYNGYSDDQTD